MLRSTHAVVHLPAFLKNIRLAKRRLKPETKFLAVIKANAYGHGIVEVGKYLALLFGVTVFILCGFEHCVANMFYFSMAGIFSVQMLVFLLLNTVGNCIGGLLIPLVYRMLKKA